MGEAARNLPVERGNQFHEIIETARQEGANLLMPTTTIEGLSEFHAPVIERVKLSSNPLDGDVYEHDNADGGPGKKWRPTKQALMKLSVCAGIIWSPTECRRIDNRSDRNYIAYQAVGGIKKSDGTPVFFKAEYDIDYEVVEEELRDQYARKAKKLTKGRGNGERPATEEEKAEYIEYCVKRDMLQKRKHGLKMCEAGAMNRVVREILGLKQAYTAAELAKPFVMVRIVFRPDYTDKDIRSKLIDAHIKQMTGIYGPTAVNRLPETTEPIDVTPIPADEPPEPEGPNGEDGGAAGPSNGAPTPEESLAIDFQNSDATSQCASITHLAFRKGYDLADYQKRAGKTIGDLSDERRLNLFRHLLSLPDPKPEDDVPF